MGSSGSRGSRPAVSDWTTVVRDSQLQASGSRLKLQTSPAGDIVSLELEDPRVGWVHLFDEAVDVLDLAATSPQRGLAHESLVFSTDSAVSIDFGHSFLNPKPQNQAEGTL